MKCSFSQVDTACFRAFLPSFSVRRANAEGEDGLLGAFRAATALDSRLSIYSDVVTEPPAAS